MTLALIDSPARTSNSPKTNSLELQNDKNQRAEPSEFGHVMSGMLNPRAQPAAGSAQALAAVSAGASEPNGQTMADKTLGLTALINPLGGDFLKAVHLGPHLNVITPETAAPDAQSLEAFARSQGLDETAVQWLMGTVPVTPPAGPTLVATAAETTTVPASAPTSVTLAAAGDALPSALSKGDSPTLANVLGSAALWAMAQATEPARSPSSASTGAGAEALSEAGQVQINLMATPAPSALWVLKNAVQVGAAKETANPKSDIAFSEIDLSQEATPELLESLAQSTESGASGAHPTPLSGHPGHRLELNASNTQGPQTQADTPSTADTDTAQRSEKVQELAEKMEQLNAVMQDNSLSPEEMRQRVSSLQAEITGIAGALTTANAALAKAMKQQSLSPDQVAKVLAKPSLAGWFVGQVMKGTGGKANPKIVNELLKKALDA